MIQVTVEDLAVFGWIVCLHFFLEMVLSRCLSGYPAKKKRAPSKEVEPLTRMWRNGVMLLHGNPQFYGLMLWTSTESLERKVEKVEVKAEGCDDSAAFHYH